MILGIGLDIVKISRIEKIIEKSQENFLQKIYTQSEIEKFYSISSKERKSEFLAKRFASKEAFSKALGVGIGKIQFHEIEIYNNANGKPEIRKTEKISQLIKDLFTVENYQINLSISDDADIAQSIVILSKI